MNDDPRRRRSVAFVPPLRGICRGVILGLLVAGTAAAQPAMKATAPEKMMPPGEKKRLEECQKMAAQKNVKMDERARYLMDCMKAKAK
jgi:hypothetical protein